MNKENQQGVAAKAHRPHRKAPAGALKKSSSRSLSIPSSAQQATPNDSVQFSDSRPSSSIPTADTHGSAKSPATSAEAERQAASFDASVNLEGVLTLMIAGNTIRLPRQQTQMLARMLQTVVD